MRSREHPARVSVRHDHTCTVCISRQTVGRNTGRGGNRSERNPLGRKRERDRERNRERERGIGEEWQKKVMHTFNLLQSRLAGILAGEFEWVVACPQAIAFALPINDVAAGDQVLVARLESQQLVVVPVFI